MRIQFNDAAYAQMHARIRTEQIPHAILIEGAQGAGKLTFALDTAQGALCTAPAPERPCGECRDCTKVENRIHPDILIYGEDGSGGKAFPVDLVREIRGQAFIRAGEGRCRVLILRNVQMMTIQAENALLKILEQPPAGVLFLMTCQNRAALTETIRSRVQTVALQTPTTAQCADFLQQSDPDLPPDQAVAAAEYANGSIGIAQRFLLNSQEQTAQSEAGEVLTMLLDGRQPEALSRLSAYERDRAGLITLLGRMHGILTRSVTLRKTESASLPAALTPLRAMKILAIIEELQQGCEHNASPLLTATLLCAKTRQLLI